MKIFKENGFLARNCGYEKYEKHPVTFGDGDHILTDRLESLSKQSLDFIFQLELYQRISLTNPELNSPELRLKKTR